MRRRWRAAAIGAVLLAAAPAAGCNDFGFVVQGLFSDAGTPNLVDAGDTVACAHGEGWDGGMPSFAADVQPIFTANCAGGGCHSATGMAGGQVLEPGMAYMNIVNVPAVETEFTSGFDRVEPGDPERSYMVHKLRGTHTDPPALGSGVRMPAGSTACFDEAAIATIVDWIARGAPND